jgi:hypothetical protein
MGELSDDGDLQPNNDILGIESFQLPPAFNPDFDASNPVDIYAITWTPNDYSPRLVEVGDRNHLNSDVYTDNFGTSVSYDLVEGTARFQVIPAPASAALIGLASLAAGRRRR